MHGGIKMKTILISVIMFFVFYSSGFPQTLEERIKILEEALKKQEQAIQDQKKVIEKLKAEIKQQKPPEGPQEEAKQEKEEALTAKDYRLDDRSRAIEVKTAAPLSPLQITKQTTPGLLNPAIGLSLDANYYYTNLSKSQLKEGSIPGYLFGVEREFQKGFNLREAELTFFAPVDPYFNLYATIPITEDGVELEEAYFVTTSLPAGFQLKGGKFKSGFGRLNAFHPHAWDFVDAPLPYRAFLGEEGLDEKGVQLTYLPTLPMYTILGFEALQGENSILYGSDATGPRAFTGFAKASVDFKSDHTLLFGGSVTGGKTKTDTVAPETQFSGTSILYDAELTYKWKPSNQKSFILQTEYMFRHQTGDYLNFSTLAVDSLNRNQDGWYIQALYQLGRWRVGARYDMLGIFTNNFHLSSGTTDFGSSPYRLTGALEFNPTEFSRIRLQYNYDRSERNDNLNNEILLQIILAIGAHGAHPF
jgi:DNA-binding protein H-NS